MLQSTFPSSYRPLNDCCKVRGCVHPGLSLHCTLQWRHLNPPLEEACFLCPWKRHPNAVISDNEPTYWAPCLVRHVAGSEWAIKNQICGKFALIRQRWWVRGARSVGEHERPNTVVTGFFFGHGLCSRYGHLYSSHAKTSTWGTFLIFPRNREWIPKRLAHMMVFLPKLFLTPRHFPLWRSPRLLYATLDHRVQRRRLELIFTPSHTHRDHQNSQRWSSQDHGLFSGRWCSLWSCYVRLNFC